jgi:hypothetical protein
MVLTIQKEGAQRICAQPGDLSLLALSVQRFWFSRNRIADSGGAFYPVPKVDSAVLVVDLYEQPLIPKKNLDMFLQTDQDRSYFIKERCSIMLCLVFRALGTRARSSSWNQLALIRIGARRHSHWKNGKRWWKFTRTG